MSPQESIAHYRITSKVGEGGMGAVYRATGTQNRQRQPEPSLLSSPVSRGKLRIAGSWSANRKLGSLDESSC